MKSLTIAVAATMICLGGGVLAQERVQRQEVEPAQPLVEPQVAQPAGEVARLAELRHDFEQSVASGNRKLSEHKSFEECYYLRLAECNLNVVPPLEPVCTQYFGLDRRGEALRARGKTELDVPFWDPCKPPDDIWNYAPYAVCFYAAWAGGADVVEAGTYCAAQHLK
jgi:hypothetical protein